MMSNGNFLRRFAGWLLGLVSREKSILVPWAEKKDTGTEAAKEAGSETVGSPPLEIKENLLPVYKYSRTGRELLAVKGVVVHWVENPRISAAGIVRWFGRNQDELPKEKRRYASTQYVIGKKGEIIRMIPEKEQAIHVGARKYRMGIQDILGRRPNESTIGIECCHKNWEGEMTEETYDSLARLCADILGRHNLKASDLYLHYDVTGKKCHRWFVANPEEWALFKTRTGNLLGE